MLNRVRSATAGLNRVRRGWTMSLGVAVVFGAGIAVGVGVAPGSGTGLGRVEER